MLKFIKHHMEGISGIEIFPMISFLIFFTFFVLMLVYVLKADKQRLKVLSNLPLENNQDHDYEKAK
tara:strand:+ start:243 stop:440 length:198 start_codon:yes stop_codon:yes gene_type:complete